MDGQWLCPHCGFRNRAANRVCGGNGPLGCKAPQGQPEPGRQDEFVVSRTWLCTSCGFSNRPSNTVCGGTGPMGCKASRQLPAEPPRIGLARIEGSAVLESGTDQVIPARELGTIRVVTYNVWFSDVRANERMSAIAEILHKCDPDVIALQELTEPFLEMLLDKFDFVMWQVLLQAPRDWYFTALMVRPGVTVVSKCCTSFDMTNMARGLQQVVVEIPDLGPVFLATSHLESPQPGAAATQTRQQQFQEAVETVGKTRVEKAVWLGDMNWIDTDGEMLLPETWMDAWLELRSGEDGTTYHANHGPSFAKVCRFDRVLSRSLRPICIARLGMNRMDQSGFFPSDHYGIFCLLQS